MAHSATDPKSAPLAQDLKELALSLPATAFPKNLFCALCNQLAIDSYKLLCCNKAICASCQTTFCFPTTCPSCEHSPLEADSCTPNKALRNTMRVWLQKQKKKEQAKAAAQLVTSSVEVTPAVPEVQYGDESVEKPAESVVETPKAEKPDQPIPGVADGPVIDEQREGSASTHPNDDTNASETKLDRRGSMSSPTVAQNKESSLADDPTDEQTNVNEPSGDLTNNNTVINEMQNQMGYGFPNQGGFSSGMGWNGMPNMMANSNWNDFNNMNGISNGIYGNFGGSMGMGMNDMSAMNMMNYGGGYGNGWSGMGGGYGTFNGSNQMGGYNQSGAYPDMMNQFPKNNFSDQNQNHNRFHANQGGQNPQQDKDGSRGNFGLAIQDEHSHPSQSGPAQNYDFESDGVSKVVPATVAEAEHAKTIADNFKEGITTASGGPTTTDTQAAQEEASGNSNKDTSDDAEHADVGANDIAQENVLNPIQTFDSGDADMQTFNQAMISNGMHPDMTYQQGLMNQFSHQQMNASFNPNMNMNMGYDQQSSFHSRGSLNNGAYGAARVLVGHSTEPVGVGVVGAPTGPRAMREGRPNTGFQSRPNPNRFPPVAPKSVTSTHEPASGSPHRRVRSRSPLRDETLRVKQRSPTRSRSRSKPLPKDDAGDDHKERSHSANRVLRRDERGRSLTPSDDANYDYRREGRSHRSSRYDERDGDYESRHRSDRDSRDDRTRDVSVESKYRSSRRDKETYRSSRSHRDRSKEYRRHHRSEDRHDDEDAYANGERGSDGSSRRKHRSGDKDKYRERERSRDKDRERDRKDRRDRDRDYEYEREKDRSREKDKDRRRRRDREAKKDEKEFDDDKHRFSRRSRKDRERDSDKERDQYEPEQREKPSGYEKDDDIVGQLMKKRAVSPPFNAPTGPSANGFSIKGRSKTTVMQPPQPPTGPRTFQPPKGPAADRNKENSEPRDVTRRSNVSAGPADSIAPMPSQDHYAAERERHARERDGRERSEKAPRDLSNHKSLHSRISSSRPSLLAKRSRDDSNVIDESYAPDAPKGPKADIKAPTGPASHRDKRRKSGATGDDNIAKLFAAGLRKNSKRRGGVRTEGDVEREMMERERERR